MKNLYLITVFLLMLISISGCENVSDEGTVIIAGDTADESLNVEYDKESTRDNNDSNTTDRLTENVKIYVYVCGHVQNPGVYELDEDARICDALSMAGGVLDDGREEVLAQAMPVSDGMTIYVPGIDEDNYDKYQRTSDKDGYDVSDDLYNINKMTKEEWMTLPGIGESKASAIIEYREEHGDFNNIEELKNIPGIKEGIYNKIKDKIKI